MKLVNNKGIATVLGFIIILILAILASAMLMRGVGGSRRTEIYVDETRAFWVAEAGIARAVWELNNGAGVWTGWTTTGNNKTLQASVGAAGDYDITVYDFANPPLKIEVTGYYPNRASENAIIRNFEVIAAKSFNPLFEYAAYSQDELTISGQGFTDSYDSSLGVYGGTNVGTDGDVGSGVAVDASGQAYVDGDVVIPEGAAYPDAAYYSGTVTEENNPELEQIIVPLNLAALPNGGSISSTTTLAPGDYQYWMINISSKTTLTITGPANIYLTGGTSISITGKAEVIIDSASTGPVNIYFDGDVLLSGQGVTNETSIPSNLILYGTSTIAQTIHVSGQADFYGAFYAPTGEMHLTGQGGLYGSFIGNEVTISGQGGVHYDEALGSLAAASASTYSITSFKDGQTPYSLSP
ncbi:MAG: hypothetical protein L6416_04705 [Candidatus Omnitrophica bacterium]|nr:hypothetical protein [Candidatus Omnitrophota bacterium]